MSVYNYAPNLMFMDVCLTVLNFVVVRKTPELLFVNFDLMVST